MANTNGIVFLWIGVQVEHHKAAGFFHDAAGKAAIIALVGDHVGNLHGFVHLKFVDAHSRKDAAQPVQDAAPVGIALVSQQEGKLVDAVHITVWGQQLGKFRSGLARDGKRCGQNVRQVKETFCLAGGNHALEIGKRRYACASFPCGALVPAERRTAIGGNLAFRPVIRGKNNQRVFNLAGIFKSLHQAGEDIVHLNHAVGIRRAGAGFSQILVAGIVVKMASARAKIQEERLGIFCLGLDEIFAVCRQVVIQVLDGVEINNP